MKQRIRLSDHFTYGRLVRYSVSAISMMIFTSIYSVVDGFFVSNYCGNSPFAALNLIYPVVMVISSIGFMLGTGGSAVVAITLGQKEREKANRYFSMFVYTAIIGGILCSLLAQIFLKEIATALGATGEMLENSMAYARIVLLSTPALILQFMFQTFFNTAEKPKLGLIVTVISGCANMILDFLFVGVFRFGLEGAAWATVVSELLGGVIPLIYFARKNDSLLRLTKTGIDLRVLLRASWNGISEFLSNICASVMSMLYNKQLLVYEGEDGVSAFGVVMYVFLLFAAVAIGYTIATSPIVGYHYGAGNKDELKNLFRKNLTVMLATGIVMFAAAELLSDAVAHLFVSYDADLMALTRTAFRVTSVTYAVFGINVFGSALFTALGNGTISAAIQVMRTLVFQVVFIFLLPPLYGTDGIWWAFVAAEAATVPVTAAFILICRKRYGYL